jgi:hypothetical protein
MENTSVVLSMNSQKRWGLSWHSMKESDNADYILQSL